MGLKVLQLGYYPIQPRISGGQRRTGAIYDGYRRNDVDVRYAILFDPGAHPEAVGKPDSFVVGPATMKAVAKNPLLIDVVIGETFDADPVCAEPLVRFWNSFQPDFVHLELCYLWPGVKRLMASGRVPRVPVIYSSQNHETAMKQAIYNRYLDSGCREDSLAKVRFAEEDLTRNADLTVVVSAGDAEVARNMGAKRIAVVRNGSDRVSAKAEDLQHWREKLLTDRTRAFALFISSSHLPNYMGFQNLVGHFLSYLPPDACIVVAGGIARFVAEQPAFREGMLLNRSRLRLLEPGLSDGDLAALVQLANAVLLPITDGGGSNIKTVEALLSGRPVIATSFAFRSYEEFKSLPRVSICDTPADFQGAIQKSLLAPRMPSMEVEPILDSVTWPILGDEFCQSVLELAKGHLV